MEPDAVEIRVVACLIEKQRTTPDVYPLSLNALRIACNQTTNRDPVVAYDEQTVSEALRRTALRGWTRLASGAGSRARKYRHLLNEALGLDDAEISLLTVLMLRGLQTPGELKQRSERSYGFADLAAVQETLDRLVERGYVGRHARRPGQKEDRYEHLLGGGEGGEAGAGVAGGAASVAGDPGPGAADPDVAVGDAGDGSAAAATDSPADVEPAAPRQDPVPLDERLRRLEQAVAELRAEFADLRADLGD